MSEPKKPSTALVPVAQEGKVPAVTVESADLYADAALSPATRDAYERAWEAFSAWCRTKGHSPAPHQGEPSAQNAIPRGPRDLLPTPPAAVRAYAAYLADHGKAWSTINKAMMAIGHMNREEGMPSPIEDPKVRQTLKGIRNVVGIAPKKQARALKMEEYPALLQATAYWKIQGARDRALISVMFFGGLRRGEAAAMRIEDIEQTPKGVVITLPRSKTNQEGRKETVELPEYNIKDKKGKLISAPFCPVRALLDWVKILKRRQGPVFVRLLRTGQPGKRALTGTGINEIIKALATTAKLEPGITSHSLRAGLATATLDRNEAIEKVAAHLRHSSIETTRTYYRPDKTAQNAFGTALLSALVERK